MVDSTKSVHQTLKSAAQTAVEKTPSPNEALKFLRSTAKSYAGLIPGASAYVDSSFDTLDQLSETHGEEVNKIVQKTYEDIRAVLQKGGMDAKTATQIYEILQKQGSELAELAKEAGMDVLEKHPELKEKLGGGWEELQRLTKDAGDSEAAQQAKKIKDETVKAVQDIFQKGISAESIIKAKELIETKTKEVRELSEKVARDAWKKGMEQYQDKMPENVKSFLSNSDTITGLVSGGGATATVAAVIGKVKELASKKGGFNDQSFEELKKFVEGKVQDGKQKGSIGLDAAWKTVESWLGSVPGGKQALEKAGDIDVSSLSSIAQGRGEDAQKLAQETYSDLLKVSTFVLRGPR